MLTNLMLACKLAFVFLTFGAFGSNIVMVINIFFDEKELVLPCRRPS